MLPSSLSPNLSSSMTPSRKLTSSGTHDCLRRLPCGRICFLSLPETATCRGQRKSGGGFQVGEGFSGKNLAHDAAINGENTYLAALVLDCGDAAQDNGSRRSLRFWLGRYLLGKPELWIVVAEEKLAFENLKFTLLKIKFEILFFQLTKISFKILKF